MNADEREGGWEMSWIRLLESLRDETVRVQLPASASTKIGLLVGVERTYITVVTGRGTEETDSTGRVRPVYIPNDKIVSITARRF